MIRVFFALLSTACSLPGAVAVTAYNDNLGLIRETRDFELSKGRQELRFADVAAGIDPTSVSLAGPEGFSVLEQDFDYDLVGSDKVLEKYLDQDIRALGKDGQAYAGRLLSFDSGQLILQMPSGGLDMVSRSELSRLEFPSLPSGLITRPTLVWQAESAVSGRRPLTLTYMTSGISWHAEYVAQLSPDEKTMDLNAWVSVDNESGASYENASLELVAGEPNRALPVAVPMFAMEKRGAAAMQQKAFFEYHLYTLDRPTTLKNSQVKQVALLSAKGVPVAKAYRFDGSLGDGKADVVLQFENSRASGLGDPLPAGKFRVYKADSGGRSEFVGEDALDHTPRDEALRIQVGKAFDVVGKRTITDTRQAGARTAEQSVAIEIRNHKDVAVEVLALEHCAGDWEISSESMKHVKKDASSFEFAVPLGPGETKTVLYTIRVKG